MKLSMVFILTYNFYAELTNIYYVLLQIIITFISIYLRYYIITVILHLSSTYSKIWRFLMPFMRIANSRWVSCLVILNEIQGFVIANERCKDEVKTSKFKDSPIDIVYFNTVCQPKGTLYRKVSWLHIHT